MKQNKWLYLQNNLLSIQNKNMKLLHGDCLELMKDIADKSIDMILCDLP